jgi:Tfp pilus assembly protein PilP
MIHGLFALLLMMIVPTVSHAVPVAESEPPMDSVLNEDLIRSLRDPFQLPTSAIVKKEIPKSELETLALKDFKLQGVISGPRKVRAMLSGAGGKTYFVKVGDRIGVRGGKITQITSDSVRITEFYQDEKGKNVPDIYELRLAGELVSLTKKDEDKQ